MLRGARDGSDPGAFEMAAQFSTEEGVWSLQALGRERALVMLTEMPREALFLNCSQRQSPAPGFFNISFKLEQQVPSGLVITVPPS